MTVIPAAAAAAQLGVSRRRISDLWRAGELRGRKHTSGLLLELSSVHERAAVGSVAGRPWAEDVVWGVVAMLSGDAAATTDVGAHRISSHTGFELGQRIASAVTTRRFEARRPEVVRKSLAVTGESALQQLTDPERERIVGGAAEIRGYVHGDLATVIETYDLIESASGVVVVHEFRSGRRRVGAETPRALAAADCLRSTNARVRRVGIDALDRMRDVWLANAI